MKLSKVYIENFRSIEDAEISFDIPFKILVGKNESGKSNILKALSYLDISKKPAIEDLREGINEFDENVSSEITFEFLFDQSEIAAIYSKLKQLVSLENQDVDSLVIANRDSQPYTLKALCEEFNAILYVVDIKTLKTRYSVWTVDPLWSVNELLFYNGLNNESNPLHQKYSKFKILHKSYISDDEIDNFRPLTIDQIHSLITTEAREILKTKHPKVINWKYEEKQLLPDTVSIDDFIANPLSYEALKTMFELAGFKNIKEAITKYKEGNNYHKFNNFLEKVAEQTTSHFRDIWKEYKNIEFTLNLNHSTIVTGIKETNTFSFQQRSDGFKRFVTFLLMISATYKNNELRDAILLIDEPDVSLHPSGIRYLRDELIKISKHNTVLVSTHSIFLIDNNNLSRHYIVKKEKEVTKIEEVNEDNIVTEEVIYNALGFSFYETLQKRNIVFEGWRDKHLFKKAISKSSTDLVELKEFFAPFGVSHIHGVKEAKSVAPVLELAGRDFILISDNDKAAQDRKKEFVKEKVNGTWYTYKDVDPKCEAVSGEDFLKQEYIAHSISLLKKCFTELGGEPIYNGKIGIVAEINSWLEKTCSISEPQRRKEIINEFKEIAFDKLKPSNIDESYYSLLTALKNKLQTT